MICYGNKENQIMKPDNTKTKENGKTRNKEQAQQVETVTDMADT
jgi:hypothetical protein